MTTATTYNVTFANQTGNAWTLVIYVTLPNNADLASVAWQLAGAAPGGNGYASWTNATSACLGTATTFNGVPGFQLAQSVSAAPDTGWNVTYSQNVQQLVAGDPPLLQGTIQITNLSGRNASPGFGLSGTGAVYKSNLASGLFVAFTPSPSYWILLGDNVSAGQVITVGRTPKRTMAAVFTPPQPLAFPSGITKATVTASMDGESVNVAIAYG